MNFIAENILKDNRFTDTRIGTNSKYEFSNGNTLPLTGVPHGQNYFAVETSSEKGSWWFNPYERRFEGFRLTHQPSPWMGDFSHMTILPYGENEEVNYQLEKSIFRPNFNSIVYSNGDQAFIVVDERDAIINFISKDSIKISFRGEGLDLRKNGRYIEGRVSNFSDCEDKEFKMYIKMELDIDFSFSKNHEKYLLITESKESNLFISTSFISEKQCDFNFQLMVKDIGAMLGSTMSKWDKYLSIFQIESIERPKEAKKYESYNMMDKIKFFYHCVYRSFLFPMKFYEVDDNNREIHYDTLSKKVKTGKLFTNVGFWDVQKTLFPLLALVAAEDYEDMLEGVLNSYRDSGYLPKWLSPDERGLMPGTLVDNVIADAAIKNIGNEYMPELFEAMLKSANKDSGNSRYGRAGVEDYKKYGYVSSSHHESVNQTLDNCLSDFSISIVAEKLGEKEIAEKYLKLSKNYKKLFDPQTKLLRAKDENGEFVKDFDPLNWGSPYTEGSSYQNSYNMYHDIEGLVGLFASKKDFESRLDEMSNAKAEYKVGHYGMVIHEMREFEHGNFGHIAISNQPSFHIPYLYHYVDRPYKTQILVKELMLNHFNYNFEGYPGDEDNGSMSAWFILSSLGIYPFCPGKAEYIMGIPLWDKVRIKLSNGRSLTISTDENYTFKKFVHKVYVDGVEYQPSKISYDKLTKADNITYELGLVPDVK